MNGRGSKTEIFSIFGQMDAVVAQAMVDEGKATKIEKDLIPEEVRFTPVGEPGDIRLREAQFAIALPRAHLAEYERRVRDLYA
jgi:hypothetical protein